MKEVKLIYTITPQIPSDIKSVVDDIKNEMDMFPSSIIIDDKEFEIEGEKELKDIIFS